MTDSPDTCPATNRDGDPCGLSAGWGTDNDDGPCKFHGGASTGAPEGNDNAETHGAFKEHFRSDLTDAEESAVDSIVATLQDVEGARAVPAEVAAEALMKYKRSADDRFLREARQWMSEFNLLPNADELNIGGEGGGAMEVIVERASYDE